MSNFYCNFASKIFSNVNLKIHFLSMKANILDFAGSGRAIIELQRYNNISILENSGFSRLKDVERDIERADTPERTEFLRRYIKAYKESFRSLPQSYICEPEDYNSDVKMCDQSS